MSMLSQDEADKLINLLKHSLADVVAFPKAAHKTTFDVKSNDTKDLFTVDIYRSKIRSNKINFGARVKINGDVLLELHLNPSATHINPDGTRISGNHWHIYKENYGRRYAFPADDITSDDFVENTIRFLEKFNVVDKPNVIYQLEL